MTVRPDRQQGLGRGLAALIPQRAPPRRAASKSRSPGSSRTRASRVRGWTRRSSRRSPRASREHGVLQPILVTETLDGYQLVAGERRLRASQLAGPRAHPRHRPPARRSGAARARPRREPPARGSRPDGGGARLRQLDRRVRDVPGGRSRPASGAPGRPSRTRSGCSTSTHGPGRRADGTISEGHARALGGLPTDQQARVARDGRRAAASRCARPKSSFAASASRGPVGRRRPARRRRPRARARRGGPAPRPRHEGHASPARAAAAGSSSSTTATRSSASSTTA